MYDQQRINNQNSITDVIFHPKIINRIKMNAKYYIKQMFIQFYYLKKRRHV